MGLLDKLERKFGTFAVPNITLYLIAGQVCCFIIFLAQPEVIGTISLEAGKILNGEVWRLFTFLFIPPSSHPVFIFFALYLFYLMGSALEELWGAFRFNIFLLIAYLATVLVSFIMPSAPFTNHFIGGSVFLAFAYLYPNFELHIFFLLPVKIKWLALLTWILYASSLLFGSASTRLLVLASVFNFLLFFGRDIYRSIRQGERRMRMRSQALAQQNKPLHQCAVCGINDKTHPNMSFRYCTKCKPARGYCKEHLSTHDHVEEKAESDSGPSSRS